MKKVCFRFVALVCMAGALPAMAELANGIKGVVDDSVVTYEEVHSLTAQTADVLVRQYRSEPSTLEKKMNDLLEENLEKLMERQLILHEFKTAGYNLPESVIDELVQERIRTDFGDRATLTKTLEARGMTYEKFRQQVRERFIVEQLRLKNISSEKIIISPHKIETYYKAHQDDFKVEDEVKLRMIVLNKTSEESAPQVRKLAEEILAKLKEGASFSEMASIYSQGSQRKEGGDWGWVERSVLRKELAEAAFCLKKGERSGVVENSESCYLMLVEDVRPAHSKPLAEVRESIEKNLLLEERNRLEKQWIERLRKKTFVRYF